MTTPSIPLPSHRAAAAAPTAVPAAAPAAPRFADARLATGVRLHFAELGDPAGAPIILLHGLGDSWFSFSQVLPGLARHGRVLALDQRGQGRSDQPDDGYAIPALAADVMAFMDARGIARATIVGHSLGSFVAQHVAARAPERVERLVLIGSSADPRNDVIRELALATAELPDPVPDDFVREFQLSTIHQPLPDAFLETVMRESHRLPARVWRTLFANMLTPEAPTALARIQAPTLAIWGDRDAVFSRADQDALMAGIPNATLLVYAESGHATHWERPERFVRDVGAFLGGAGKE